MTPIPTPEAVEPISDEDLAAIRDLHEFQGLSLDPPSNATFDQIFARLEALAARALPTPRRYTGGPLEDGLYLWREDGWREGYWESREIVPDLMQRPFWFRQNPGPLWLIGPIPIPNLPEEEKANG